MLQAFIAVPLRHALSLYASLSSNYKVYKYTKHIVLNKKHQATAHTCQLISHKAVSFQLSVTPFQCHCMVAALGANWSVMVMST